MKKIGLLFGIEKTFSKSVINNINNRKINNVIAEPVKVGAMGIDNVIKYSVILDRVSKEVEFYKTILKQSVLKGVQVVNSPFWNKNDNNFYQLSWASQSGIKVPKTAVLPSKEHPPGTNSETMKNLEYPIDWKSVFEYVGFPSIIKPNCQNSFQGIFKVYNQQEFFSAYDLTGNKPMLLQESIGYDEYYRCFVIGDKSKAVFYNPEKPLNQRYISGEWKITADIESKITEMSLVITKAFNLEINVVDFALRKGEIFAIELFNPMANSEKENLHDDNFNWVVEHTADLLISKALKSINTIDIDTISEESDKPEPKSSVKKRGRPKNK